MRLGQNLLVLTKKSVYFKKGCQLIVNIGAERTVKLFVLLEPHSSFRFQYSLLTIALFTRYKLTRVSFCRVHTANPGSTRVSLSCKHY